MKAILGIVLLIAQLTLLSSTAAGFQATFLPRLTVGEEYTDNLVLSEKYRESDFITSIAPGISLGLAGQTSGLRLAYDPSYNAYAEYSKYNYWRHAATLNGWADISRHTRVSLQDTFRHTEDPLSEADLAVLRTTEPNFPVDTTERRGRNAYSRNVGNVDLVHQFGAQDSFRLGYTDVLLVNDDPAYEDNSAHEPWAGITWYFLPHWGVDVDVRYTKGEYEFSEDRDRIFGNIRLVHQFTRNFDGYVRYAHTNVHYDGVTGDDRTYNPSIGIDYEIEKDISLQLEVGYFKNDFDLREDQDGMTGKALLVKRFERGSINFSTIGGYDYADFGTTQINGFQRFVESAVSTTYRFARRVSGIMAAYYRYSDYVDLDRQDQRLRASAGLSVQPLEWMTIDLRYAYNQLISTVDANEYKENRGTLSVRIAPAVPYRTGKY